MNELCAMHGAQVTLEKRTKFWFPRTHTLIIQNPDYYLHVSELQVNVTVINAGLEKGRQDRELPTSPGPKVGTEAPAPRDACS